MEHCVDRVAGSLWHADLVTTLPLSDDDVFTVRWQPPSICLVLERWMSLSCVLWDSAGVEAT